MSKYKLTGDDDSVAHAWNTEEVPVIVDIDKGIAPLIRVLNKIPGVRTFASCEGHLHSESSTDAYVYLHMPPESVLPLAAMIEKALEMSKEKPMEDDTLLDRLLFDLEQAVKQYKDALKERELVRAMAAYASAKCQLLHKFFESQGIDVPAAKPQKGE